MSDSDPEVEPETHEADERDAEASHGADRPPTAEEEAAAPEQASSSTAAAYEEALERGANVKGEGQIE